MFGWGKRKKPVASQLALLLASYPPCTPPHIGQNGTASFPGQPVLTIEQ